VGAEFLELWPHLLEGGEAVLLVKIVNRATLALIGISTLRQGGIVEIAVQSSPSIQLSLLGGGRIKAECDSAG
jgi:hypothetical protein